MILFWTDASRRGGADLQPLAELGVGALGGGGSVLLKLHLCYLVTLLPGISLLRSWPLKRAAGLNPRGSSASALLSSSCCFSHLPARVEV